MTPDTFIDLFKSGQPAPHADVTGLCSRIIRIGEPSHRDRLSGDDPSRRIVFVTNAQGSADLLGKNGWECLMHIGYPDDWARTMLPAGPDHRDFELIVFPAAAAKQATWEGFMEVVATAYPDVAGDCQKHLASLKSWQYFWYFMKLGFYIESQKKKTPHGDPNENYMTLERYLASPREVQNFRAFLAHSCYANELFSGDGYTYDSDGNKGLAEFVMPDMAMSDIPGVARVDLTVVAP